MRYIRKTRAANPKTMKLTSVLFIVVGLIFIVVGAVYGVKGSNTDDGRIYTTATITRVESYYRHTGDGYEKSYRTHVEYEVDGETISTILSSYTFTHKAGKQLEIYYYPDSPTIADDKNGHLTFMIVLPLMGLIAVAAGISPLFKMSKKRHESNDSSNGNSNDINSSGTMDYPTID